MNQSIGAAEDHSGWARTREYAGVNMQPTTRVKPYLRTWNSEQRGNHRQSWAQEAVILDTQLDDA